jgi:hypothetical protein
MHGDSVDGFVRGDSAMPRLVALWEVGEQGC